ncbi:MAG: alternative ribosome rescue aminoacyl-tRNA hydrolase ArfB [Myxococcota bacterium]
MPTDGDVPKRLRPRDVVVRRGLVIPASELVETASRAGGPGGQHVNKANTRVSLRWNARGSSVLGPVQRQRLLDRLGARLTASGELVVHASRHRSRERNREAARERLAELVRGALVVERARVATRPTRASRERKLAEKRRRSGVKRTRGRVRRDDD